LIGLNRYRIWSDGEFLWTQKWISWFHGSFWHCIITKFFRNLCIVELQ
jgi:hypothetical protein